MRGGQPVAIERSTAAARFGQVAEQATDRAPHLDVERRQPLSQRPVVPGMGSELAPSNGQS